MKQFKIKPTIHEYEKFETFANEFKLKEKDLIITNKYILKDSSSYGGCYLLFQEEYGMGEPTDVMINRILKEVSQLDYDRIIAIGGGTVLDIAKIMAVSGTVSDIDALYEGMSSLKKYHKLILIPTTCGTGSEITNIAVVNRTKLGTKQGLVSESMYADEAVLISQFIATLPYAVFATSSLDALVHAVESYLSPQSTAYSRIFSVEAIKWILLGYKALVEKTNELSTLGGQFIRASNYAGIAFGNAGCGTVHAMSYAFGGKYHVPHGESNYEFFIPVLRFYEKHKPKGRLEELLAILTQYLDAGDVIGNLEKLLNEILPYKAMSTYGATEDDIFSFSKSTIDNQQRLLKNSYFPLTQDDIAEIYKRCL